MEDKREYYGEFGEHTSPPQETEEQLPLKKATIELRQNELKCIISILKLFDGDEFLEVLTAYLCMEFDKVFEIPKELK